MAGASGRTAILIVNGFDRRGIFGSYNGDEVRLYPWIDLCLRQIRRWSGSADYEILVYDNTGLPEHLAILHSDERVRIYPSGGEEKAHHDALDALVGWMGEEFEYALTLDNDAFPVRAGWIEELTAALDAGAGLAGVWRDEMAPTVDPFVHPSGLCIRRRDLLALDISFARGMGQDVGQNLTRAMAGADRPLHRLRRSNARNLHFLLGGLYGDLIYHQGAGNRRARFWTSTDLEADERARQALRDAAFRDIDHLVAVLRGEADDDLGL
jgi:hypothetical protein